VRRQTRQPLAGDKLNGENQLDSALEHCYALYEPLEVRLSQRGAQIIDNKAAAGCAISPAN
jgi:hypothetical protein